MILIFAGAGASKAVNSEEYPTTIEFFQRLPEDITKNKLFNLTQQFLIKTKGKKSPEEIDIEEVIWILKELNQLLSEINNEKSAGGWFFQGTRLLSIVSERPQDLNSIVNQLDGVIKKITQLENRINRQVYDYYGNIPQENEFKENWLLLLEKILNIEKRIEIFTTNYDVVIEEVLEFLKTKKNLKILNGRTQKILPYLDLNLWKDKKHHVERMNNYITLTKLHGSVDWSHDKDRISIGNRTFKGSHEIHVILYPGFKGEPEKEPFSTFHNYFRGVLQQAKAVIFIGFSFRDEFINSMLQEIKPSSSLIININPDKELSNLPFKKEQIKYIIGKFDSATINKALNALSKASQNNASRAKLN